MSSNNQNAGCINVQKTDKSQATAAEIVLSFFMPFYGIFFGVMYLNSGKRQAGKTMIKTAIINIAICIIIFSFSLFAFTHFKSLGGK